MKHKSHSIMDLFKGVRVIGEVVRKLELKPMGDFIPEFGREATNESTALLSSGDVVFHDQESGDCYEFPMISS